MHPSYHPNSIFKLIVYASDRSAPSCNYAIAERR